MKLALQLIGQYKLEDRGSGQKVWPNLKNNLKHKGWEIAQVEECLSTKFNTLSSILSTIKQTNQQPDDKP
jgi:hypothetical protein